MNCRGAIVGRWKFHENHWNPAVPPFSRVARQAEFPARSQLVAAMNPYLSVPTICNVTRLSTACATVYKVWDTVLDFVLDNSVAQPMEKGRARLSWAVLLGLLCGLPFSAQEALTDEQIRQLLIQESISTYRGNCPCPYSHTRNGTRCSKRSAYSKPGSYTLLCYEGDVTSEMV